MKKSPIRIICFVLLLLMIASMPAAAVKRQGRARATIVVLATVHKQAFVDKRSMRHTRTVPEGKKRVVDVAASEAKRRPSSVAAVVRAGARPRISARSAIIMDASNNGTIYARAPERPGQPASTLKVLTGLLAIDSLKNTTLVPVSRRAASMPRSKVYLERGGSYRANDLINAVLLASANDASVALAEKIAGTEWAFANRMTTLARDLGARKTICKTASGLTAKGQQTTARDLAVIFNKAMANKEFAARIARTRTTTSYGKSLRNHNRALWQITGAEGGKTGYTRAARQTYVGKFKRGQDELVVAIMGSRTMWDDIRNLVEYGFANKNRRTTVVRNDQSPPVVRQTSQPHRTELVVLADTKKIARL